MTPITHPSRSVYHFQQLAWGRLAWNLSHAPSTTAKSPGDDAEGGRWLVFQAGGRSTLFPKFCLLILRAVTYLPVTKKFSLSRRCWSVLIKEEIIQTEIFITILTSLEFLAFDCMLVRTLASSSLTERTQFESFWKLSSMWIHLRPWCRWSKQCYASWVWFWKICFCSHFVKNLTMSLVMLRNELIFVWGREGVVLCFSFISQTNYFEKIWMLRPVTHAYDHFCINIRVHVYKFKEPIQRDSRFSSIKPVIEQIQSFVCILPFFTVRKDIFIVRHLTQHSNSEISINKDSNDEKLNNWTYISVGLCDH